jgi:hypothetical protein
MFAAKIPGDISEPLPPPTETKSTENVLLNLRLLVHILK